jgi:hypothetical protein
MESQIRVKSRVAGFVQRTRINQVTAVNPPADFLVLDKHATVSRCYALVHLAYEPFVVIDEALDRFLCERLRVAAPLGCDARELDLDVGTQANFDSDYP